MSSRIVEKISGLFEPRAPHWACEFTSKHVIAAGVDKKRHRLEGKAISGLRPGIVNGSLSDVNIPDRELLRPVVQETLRAAGFKGSEIGVVIPDDAARVTFLVTEKFSRNPEEQLTFIRWKLKKTVPFDVDAAQVSFKLIGPARENGAKAGVGQDLLVTMSPRAVVEEYEGLMESLGLHAGFILPSTLAALNLFGEPALPPEDTLFLKLSPDSVTTSIFQGKRIQFYRKVSSDGGLYDAVYPTVLYYQDKLGGKAIQQITVCGYDETQRASILELQEKLGVAGNSLEPKNVDDIFKPVLGAVHFSWANLI